MHPLDQQIIARIKASPLTLTIVASSARQAPAGSAATTAPTSPLTGAAPSSTVLTDGTAAPYLADVTMPCLWMDEAAVLSDNAFNQYKVAQLGWVQGATALARVLVSDAALVATNPYAGTKFDAGSKVTYQGRAYMILSVQPFGSGSRIPVTYHVWLKGLSKGELWGNMTG